MRTNLILLMFVLIFGYHNPLMAQKQGGQSQRKHICEIENQIPDLTDQQKEAINRIHLDSKKKMLPITNSLQEKRAHLNTLRTADNPNQEAINKEIEEIGRLRTDLMKIREGSMQKIRTLLTEDQRIIFDSKMKTKNAKMRNHSDYGHKCNH